MEKKLTITVAAMLLAGMSWAQTKVTTDGDKLNATGADESAFTFTEAQLGEDDDMSQNVTILGANSNLYASQVGYQFSSVRFRYRAFNQKYNDIYINGMQMNDMETGQFRFSLVGGLNNQTRNVEFALPFEDNQFALSSMGGSNNYNFRAGSMATGHRASIAAANRNYTLRGMYTYNSGFDANGWAWSASLTYRWANTKTAYVKGTFYNSLSYFFGVEKILGINHHLSFSTWGNPTERAGQGGATDEMYWLANSNFYNPYWGYQNGKIRNSRIVNDFAPSGLFTWDWKINDHAKLVTTLGGRYSMYKSTKLNYNNSDNPQPDYWKMMPSAIYDVWNPSNTRNNSYTATGWQEAYDYFTASEENRQINWDRLYSANQSINSVWSNASNGQMYQGAAMYFIQAKRNDALTLQLNSVLNVDFRADQHLTAGIGLGGNHARHYQTMEDLLGANHFYNINTYALSTYGSTSSAIQYDLNNPNASVGEGDVFGYDYYLNVNKGNAWINYSQNKGRFHYFIGMKMGYTSMQRDGRMRNGLAADNSYGKSKTANFVDCEGKAGLNVNLGKGHAIMAGLSYGTHAPQASVAFASPEINNDFVTNLHNEHVLNMELGYQLKASRFALNVNGYYTRIDKGTEWQNYYFDDENSFTYVSLTGISKDAYGVEAAMKVKLTSFLDFKALGTISDARYLNNFNARYMLSKSADYNETKVYASSTYMKTWTEESKDPEVISKVLAEGGTLNENGTVNVEKSALKKYNLRESGTPLTAASLGLSFHMNGWYVDISGNWYDRIYLSWSPTLRYESTLKTQGKITTGVDANGNIANVIESYEQTKGHGGWMMDGSIGKNIYLKKGSLSINLSVSNILNNTKICTGGYEQSRSSYTTNADGSSSGARVYNFYKNPKKFYAYGTNGMLNVTYKF